LRSCSNTWRFHYSVTRSTSAQINGCFPHWPTASPVSGKCSASQSPCCFHSDVARLRGQREVTGWQTVCAGINRYADNALQWLASQLHRAQADTSGMLCGSCARLSGSQVSPGSPNKLLNPARYARWTPNRYALGCRLA